MFNCMLAIAVNMISFIESLPIEHWLYFPYNYCQITSFRETSWKLFGNEVLHFTSRNENFKQIW